MTIKIAQVKIEYDDEKDELNFMLFGEPSPALDFGAKIMAKVCSDIGIVPTHEEISHAIN